MGGGGSFRTFTPGPDPQKSCYKVANRRSHRVHQCHCQGRGQPKKPKGLWQFNSLEKKRSPHLGCPSDFEIGSGAPGSLPPGEAVCFLLPNLATRGQAFPPPLTDLL